MAPTVPKTVCLTCPHHQERERKGVPAPRAPVRPGRPSASMADLRRECTWYNTRAGLAADEGARLAVMTAEYNGGRDCPVASGG